MRSLYIVEGMGGTRRSRDGAAAGVVEAAADAGWTPTIVSLEQMAERIRDQSVDVARVVLCGGDGLIHRAIPHLVETDVEVAVVPVGSGNDFARAFGIDFGAALRLATQPAGEHWSTVSIDVIAVNAGVEHGTECNSAVTTALAASVLTAGYTGRVNATANRLKFPPGSAKYTVAALREMRRLAAVEAQLVLLDASGTQQQVIEGPLTMFAVGNTGFFGGGMHICPHADATDGLLDVVTVGLIGKLEFTRWLPKVFTGDHLEHPAVTTARAASVRIETTESLWADGELLGSKPSATERNAIVHVATVLPRSLRLLRPRLDNKSSG